MVYAKEKLGRNVDMDERKLNALFEKWCQKLRIVPDWDVKLELVEDSEWRKTGDFKIDCDDKKAVLMLNVSNPRKENLEEVIVHELMHLKMYPLDQVTESLIINTFEEGRQATLPTSNSLPPLSRPWRKWQSVFCWNSGKTGNFPLADAQGRSPLMNYMTDLKISIDTRF